jgi:hypothetical protein
MEKIRIAATPSGMRRSMSLRRQGVTSLSRVGETFSLLPLQVRTFPASWVLARSFAQFAEGQSHVHEKDGAQSRRESQAGGPITR